MHFKLRQMEVFRAVMLTGTVSGAARMLYVSQPAVSKLLTHTETNLGLKLFDRIGGKLVPTTAAKTLFEQVQQVYDAALKVDSLVENLVATTVTEISISSSPSLGLSLMPKVIEHYQQSNPSTRVHFHTTLTRDVPLEILSGKIDFAVTVLPLDNPNLTIEKLATGRMVCALPQHHPLTAKTAISLADLADQRTVFYPPSIPFGRLILSTLEAHGLHIVPQIDVPRAELACAMARRGLGVAIVDEFSVAGDIWVGIEVRPIVEEISFDVNLVFPKFNMLTRPAEEFIAILRQCVASHVQSG